MGLNIGIVGGTGAVGQKMLEVMKDRKLDIENIRLFASERTAGSKIFIDILNRDVEVELLSEEVLKDNFDYLLFAAGGSISEKYAKIAVDAGNIVIDNSSHFRMNQEIPLIVPEVNGDILRNYRGIIANPNCSTTQMVLGIYPIYKKYGIKNIVVSTYQAVSGSGYRAIEELKSQNEDENAKVEVYTRRIAGNCIPHIDSFDENGFTKEELKMVYETHKILNDDSIKINPTAVRVPVVYGHSESIYLELEKEVDILDIKNILSQTEGIIVKDDLDNNIYPTPIEAAGDDYVHIGRIRKDLYNKKALSMWIVADNLRKGAATNAIQIIEKMESFK